ncbi:TPA: hypothetical protein ACHTCP_002890 [Escherichia coli]
MLAISVAQVWVLCKCCKCLRMWRNFFYRMWGIAELRWVVTLAAGLEDESQGMTVGKKLKLPPATWIREMIRHFQYDGQVIGTLSIA